MKRWWFGERSSVGTPLGENRNGRKNNTGRDHHPFSFTMLLSGGGIQGGLTYGKSDEIGWGIDEHPVHVNDPARHDAALFRHGSRKTDRAIPGTRFPADRCWRSRDS